jgi:hypothetical protein
MKIHLELTSETLAGLRAELEAFLAPVTASTTAAIKANPIVQGLGIGRPNVSVPGVATKDVPGPSAADIALGLAVETPSGKPTHENGQTRSAADIALDDADDDTGDAEDDDADLEEIEADLEEIEDVDTDPAEETASPLSKAEALLADKAQLQFDFERVLALQGRAAALGIVRGVLPRGTKTKLKDIEALPVELIPAAIAALQAAEAN